MTTELPITEEEFAALVAHRISQCVEGTVHFDRGPFALLVKDELGRVNQQLNLGKFYREFCHAADPGAKEGVLQRVLEAQQTRPKQTYDEAAPTLMPHIRDRWTTEEWKLMFALGRIGPPDKTANLYIPSIDIADVFSLVAATDMPETRMIVSSTQLDSWKVTFEEVLDRSLSNLHARTTGIFETLRHTDTGEDSVHYSTWRDNYDSSRLLMSGMLNNLHVTGQHVIGIPSNNVLLVTGSEDQLGLTILLSAYEEAKQDGHCLAPFPLVLKDDTLSRFQLPSNHPLYYSFLHLQVDYLYVTYRQQQELLEAQYEQLLGDFRLGNYDAVQDKNGNVVSYATVATVTTDGPQLIPKTEFIAFTSGFGDRKQLIACGNWNRVMEICGDLFTPTEHYPQRYRIDVFPSQEQIRRIGNEPFFV